MKKSVQFIYIGLITLLASCQNHDFEVTEDSLPSGQRISFVVGEISDLKEAATTKADSLPSKQEAFDQIVLYSESGKKLVLNATKKKGIKSPLPKESANTKSYAVDETNLQDIYGSGVKNSLGIKAYYSLESTTPYIDDYLEYDSDASSSLLRWIPNKGLYYWPKTGTLDLWAWAPNQIDANKYNVTRTFTSSGIVQDGKIAFSYDLGEGSTNDAKQQPDLLFARVPDATEEDNNPVEYEFYHALSAVEFEMASNFVDSLQSITIKDVIREGNCVFDPSTTSPFTWTYDDDDRADYKQAFSGRGKHISQDMDNPQLINSGSDEDAVFMMIPQEIEASSSQLVFVFKDETYLGYLPQGEWEAGYTYTYTVLLDGDVDVMITDIVTLNTNETLTKSDIVITNTGTCASYIRVLISASWCYGFDEEMVILKPYTGAMPTTLGTNWFLGSDGFYYYQLPVQEGYPTNYSIFDSFTIDPSTTPRPGTHLEMQLVVQAVKFDLEKYAVSKAWGATAAASLSTTAEVPLVEP